MDQGSLDRIEFQQVVAAMWSNPKVRSLLERAARTYAARRSTLLGSLAARGVDARGRSGSPTSRALSAQARAGAPVPVPASPSPAGPSPASPSPAGQPSASPGPGGSAGGLAEHTGQRVVAPVQDVGCLQAHQVLNLRQHVR